MKKISRRDFLRTVAGSALFACPLSGIYAQELKGQVKESHAPDVVFVPTPQDVVDKMLELAKVKKDDLVYDLGCGDGRIVTTAARRYGCKAVGYDINPQRVEESLENVEKNNVEHLVRIEQKDIFTLDLSKADVVTLYLLPDLNVKLIPQLDKLKPGSRIVSHDFRMRGVRPDKVIRLTSSEDHEEHKVYLWTAPLKKRKKSNPEPAATSSLKHPNLVIFVADDLGWNDVGYHGSVVETPNINGLVADGVELDRYYSYPICGPTRVALMTGRNPIRLGATGNFKEDVPGLDLGEHLMPQSFKAAGYQTFCLGKWHLGGFIDDAYLPHNRGFDHFYGHLHGSSEPYRHTVPSTGKPDWQRNGVQLNEEGKYCTDLLADEAVKLLRNRDKSRPVFLYMPFHVVHTPLREPPTPKAEKYAAKGVTDQRRQILATMVDAMDAAIGRVLDTIDTEGMRDNTLVLFASDNGGAEDKGGASNDPLRGEKGQLWEGGIRVPAAMRWPGVLAAGHKCRQVISVMDWFPTLTAALGVEPQNKRPFDGKNLWPAIRDGKEVPPEEIVIAKGDAVILDGEWKLVQVRETGRNLLFRINDDPSEERDLSAEHPEVVRELSARIKAMTDLMPPRQRTGSGRRRADQDEGERQRRGGQGRGGQRKGGQGGREGQKQTVSKNAPDQ